jgi:hypothetical protein
MVKKPSPERSKNFDATLASRSDARATRDGLIAVRRKNVASTIEVLQRRVKTQFIPVELPGGDEVNIRTSLSFEDLKEIDELKQERMSLAKIPEEKQEAIDAIRLQLLNIVPSTPSTWSTMASLGDKIKELEAKPKEVIDREKEIDYTIVEIITADEELTAAWLMDNPECFSPDDILWILNGYYEQRIKQEVERKERISQASTFRRDR